MSDSIEYEIVNWEPARGLALRCLQKLPSPSRRERLVASNLLRPAGETSHFVLAAKTSSTHGRLLSDLKASFLRRAMRSVSLLP